MRYNLNDQIGTNVFGKTSFFFLTLTMVALLYVADQKKAKAEDAEPPKAEFLIVTEWPQASHSDVDTWMRAPGGETIWYSNKQQGPYFLDIDDLGWTDTVIGPDGVPLIPPTNREVVTLRGWARGPYTVNLHLYRYADKDPIEVTVRVLKLNPSQIVVERKVVLDTQGQESTVATFTVDKDGKVTGLSYDPVILTRKGV